MSWHPASPDHFASLSSDGVFRLYQASNPSEPEQSFALQLPGSFRGGSLGLSTALGGRRGGTTPARPTAFAWGPPGGAGSWGALSVLFLGTDGGVYCLCPIAPFGLRVAAGALRRLLESCSTGDWSHPGDAGRHLGDGVGGGGTARAWLQAAFPGVVHPAGEILAGGEGFTVQPHLLETWVPALQGPLNAGYESSEISNCPGRAQAASLAISARSAPVIPGGRRLFDDAAGYDEEGYYGGAGDEGYGAGDGGGVTCCAVITALDDGRAYAHVLDSGAMTPMWTEGLPQCAYSQRMDVAAVRCECETVPVTGAGEGDNSTGGWWLGVGQVFVCVLCGGLGSRDIAVIPGHISKPSLKLNPLCKHQMTSPKLTGSDPYLPPLLQVRLSQLLTTTATQQPPPTLPPAAPPPDPPPPPTRAAGVPPAAVQTALQQQQQRRQAAAAAHRRRRARWCCLI